MTVLEIGPQKDKLFDELETIAADKLLKYLKGEAPGGDDIRVAQATMSNIAKNRQTSTAREALIFNMVQSVADERNVEKFLEARHPKIMKDMKRKDRKKLPEKK